MFLGVVREGRVDEECGGVGIGEEMRREMARKYDERCEAGERELGLDRYAEVVYRERNRQIEEDFSKQLDY